MSQAKQEHQPHYVALVSVIAGAISGSMGVATGFPLETIRVRLQTQQVRNDFRGLTDCLVKTLRGEGLKGCFFLFFCLLTLILVGRTSRALQGHVFSIDWSYDYQDSELWGIWISLVAHERQREGRASASSDDRRGAVGRVCKLCVVSSRQSQDIAADSEDRRRESAGRTARCEAKQNAQRFV